MAKKEAKPKKYATIVIDTTTELEIILNQYVYEELAAMKDNKKRLAPNEYTLRNTLMSAVFNLPIDAGLNFVALQYMKTKWEQDEKGNFRDTGKKILDGWSRTESQTDVNIQMVDCQPVITGCWMGNQFNGQRFDSDYETVLATLLEGIYGDEEDFPNLGFSVTGYSKQGKTHFAYTFPQPIKVYAFNRGAGFLRRKFPDRDIDVTYYPIPADKGDGKAWAGQIWTPFYEDYKKTVGV